MDLVSIDGVFLFCSLAASLSSGTAQPAGFGFGGFVGSTRVAKTAKGADDDISAVRVVRCLHHNFACSLGGFENDFLKRPGDRLGRRGPVPSIVTHALLVRAIRLASVAYN
jgi:hypothetical protein